jgi:3D (Asp-Asp-Asp) domain-containing protein
MLNKLAKINRISAILIIFVSFAFTFYANATQAKVFDWFLGDSSGDVSGPIQNLGSAVYMTSDSTPATGSLEETQPVVVQNHFLGSSAAPANTSKPQTSRQFVKTQKNYSFNGREYVVSATGYSSTPDQTDSSPFITANGSHVHDGTIAANFLPFGTKVMIPEYFGDKVFIVEDRMNARYTNRVDIWYPDRDSAMQWGLRTIKIQIVNS